MDYSRYILSLVHIWHLVIHWKGQSAWAVTCSVWQDLAPHLQCELHSESIHKTPQELSPDSPIPVQSCCFRLLTLTQFFLPFMAAVSHLMDKRQHRALELALLHLISFFFMSKLLYTAKCGNWKINCRMEIWLYMPCSVSHHCNWLIFTFEGEYRIVWKIQKQSEFRHAIGNFISFPSLHHSWQDYQRPVHSRLLSF